MDDNTVNYYMFIYESDPDNWGMNRPRCVNGRPEVKLTKDWGTDRHREEMRESHNWALKDAIRLNPDNRDLHAHITSDSNDCDGPIERGCITWISDIRGVTDDFDFKNYMVGSAVSIWNPGCSLTVVNPDEVHVSNPNDEGGGCFTTIKFCSDEDCRAIRYKTHYRDVYAEQMGF